MRTRIKSEPPRFHLDRQAAARWLRRDFVDDQGGAPIISPVWNPLEHFRGEDEATVENLIYHVPSSILSGPSYGRVFFQYVGDDDHLGYRWLLDVEFQHRGSAQIIQMTSSWLMWTGLVPPGVTGIEAAVYVLGEAADESNARLDSLLAYVQYATGSPMA